MDWVDKPLSSMCDNLDSQRVPITKSNRVEGNTPYYGASGIVDYVEGYIFDENLLLVSEDGANLLARTYPIAFSVTGKTWVNNHAHVLKFNNSTTQRFVEYYLNAIPLNNFVTGMAQPKLNQRTLNSIPIPAIDLEEQKRIVAILDQAFADIDKARATAERNLKNARELFDSYLQQVYSYKNCNQSPLGEVVDVLTDYHANGSYKILKEHVELKETEDYAWMVRSTDFEKKFQNDKRYISESAYKYLKKTPLFGGEIIMSKIGNAGKVYFMPEVNRPCSLAMNLFLIRLNPKKANNEYIFRYLNSRSGKAQIAPLLNGAATQTITKDSVRSLKVYLPDLARQAKVVQELNELSKRVSSLEEIYTTKISLIEELKKSILQKAFTGELAKSKGIAA
jgi:type I restriction enzyme S subunit